MMGSYQKVQSAAMNIKANEPVDLMADTEESTFELLDDITKESPHNITLLFDENVVPDQIVAKFPKNVQELQIGTEAKLGRNDAANVMLYNKFMSKNFASISCRINPDKGVTFVLRNATEKKRIKFTDPNAEPFFLLPLEEIKLNEGSKFQLESVQFTVAIDLGDMTVNKFNLRVMSLSSLQKATSALGQIPKLSQADAHQPYIAQGMNQNDFLLTPGINQGPPLIPRGINEDPPLVPRGINQGLPFITRGINQGPPLVPAVMNQGAPMMARGINPGAYAMSSNPITINQSYIPQPYSVGINQACTASSSPIQMSRVGVTLSNSFSSVGDQIIPKRQFSPQSAGQPSGYYSADYPPQQALMSQPASHQYQAIPYHQVFYPGVPQTGCPLQPMLVREAEANYARSHHAPSNVNSDMMSNDLIRASTKRVATKQLGSRTATSPIVTHPSSIDRNPCLYPSPINSRFVFPPPDTGLESLRPSLTSGDLPHGPPLGSVDLHSGSDAHDGIPITTVAVHESCGKGNNFT